MKYYAHKRGRYYESDGTFTDNPEAADAPLAADNYEEAKAEAQALWGEEADAIEVEVGRRTTIHLREPSQREPG